MTGHLSAKYKSEQPISIIMRRINVKGLNVSVMSHNNDDYISLTDMIAAKDGKFFVSDWLRNRNTIEYIGIWEQVHNPNFNYGEYAIIQNQAGLNRYKLSVQEWVRKTSAIGLRAQRGRYGGTYAHKDIAFEFGMWINPEFKVYLIKEFQRLKLQEHDNVGWDIRRILSRINYSIHTDAIDKYLLPRKLTEKQKKEIYADEAELLNVALFGMTSADWRKISGNKKGNLRDNANSAQLVCLVNLENLNALFIQEGIAQSKRLAKLNQIARSQIRILNKNKISEIT